MLNEKLIMILFADDSADSKKLKGFAKVAMWVKYCLQKLKVHIQQKYGDGIWEEKRERTE